MDTVLITGSEGQLGRCLIEILQGAFKLKALDKNDFDLLHPADIRYYLEKDDIRAVINCAAYTAVDQAESEPELAEKINSTAVGIIAAACASRDIPLIHISTDYVYDNGLRRPLKETDPLKPESVYAKTKLAGEQAALLACENTFILRTSWVFSEFGKNFLLTMLRLSDKGIAPSVVSNQRGCPTYARDLAMAIAHIVANLHSAKPGVYNYCNSGDTTWYEFAIAIYKAAGRSTEVKPTTTEEFGAAAPRPAYSVLDTTRFQQVFNMIPRDWHQALDECIARLSDNGFRDN